MKHTQHIKDRANILQAHLANVGLTLSRGQALNLIAQLDGYRSFTAAHHGRQHAAKGVLGGALRKVRTINGGYSQKVAVEDYLADGGQHCPECGGTRIHDAQESSAGQRHWEILMRCQDCHTQWWAVYALESRDGFRLGTARAAKALHDEECPYCDADSGALRYGTFTAGARGYQSVQCGSCRSQWMDIYKLVNAAEPQ